MSYTFYISEEVIATIDVAAKRYETEDIELEKKFREAIRTRFTQIQRNPEMFQEIGKNQRRAVLGSPFPYNIYYSIDEKTKTIDIGGVFHQQRKLEYVREQIRLERLQKIRDKKIEKSKRMEMLERIRKRQEKSRDRGRER
jgi:hypothetical protein